MSKARQKATKAQASFVTLNGGAFNSNNKRDTVAYNLEADPLALIGHIVQRNEYVDSIVGLVHVGLLGQEGNEEFFGALLAVERHLKESKRMLNILAMQLLSGSGEPSASNSKGGASC